MHKSNIKTAEQTLVLLTASTFERLTKCYLLLNPAESQDTFKKNFIDPFLNLDATIATTTAIGDNVFDRMYKAPNEKIPENSKNAPLLISAAYCIQALRFWDDNERDMAWRHMAQASYWCGVANANIGIESARNKTIIATRRNTATKGSAGRNKGFSLLKVEAFRLTREKLPKRGIWRSASNAAEDIKEEVLQYAEKQNIKFSKNNSTNTISSWLGEMPDAKSLFETFKNIK